jgi:Putative peptidoglycan binding domain
MRTFGSFSWLVAAAVAASLPITAPAVPGRSMGGFGHSMGGFAGGGPHHSMGVSRGGGPHASMGQRFGHNGRFFNDHRFVSHDRFFDHRFVNHDRFFDHRFVSHDRFFDHRFVNHDRFFDNHQFVDNRFVNNQFVNNQFVNNQFVNNRFHDRFFFHHHNNFIFVFDFVSFGFPVGFPVSFPGWYPAYTGYPYDYSYAGYRPVYDDQYWTNLALAVQSELAQRGYYRGAIDGEIGSDSREAIRAFQEAQGLPVTGKIDAKLLDALGIKYKTA